MSFLFRKYLKDEHGNDISQSSPGEVSPEETPPVQPLEFRLWPPSPKAQIILIAVALILFNIILFGIWAIVLWQNS
jgi:hypothetical protein